PGSFWTGPATSGRPRCSVSEAALTGNTIVVCYAAIVFALNATTGAVIWMTTPGGAIHASPAVSGPAADQVLFVGDVHGTEYGLNLQTGARVFRCCNRRANSKARLP